MITNFKLADDLRDGIHNHGCEGTTHDLRFAIAALTKQERSKLRVELDFQDARGESESQ
jgi:hypothetical protein